MSNFSQDGVDSLYALSPTDYTLNAKSNYLKVSEKSNLVG